MRQKQEVQKFKGILGYKVTLRPAWTTLPDQKEVMLLWWSKGLCTENSLWEQVMEVALKLLPTLKHPQVLKESGAETGTYHFSLNTSSLSYLCRDLNDTYLF